MYILISQKNAKNRKKQLKNNKSIEVCKKVTFNSKVSVENCDGLLIKSLNGGYYVTTVT